MKHLLLKSFLLVVLLGPMGRAQNVRTDLPVTLDQIARQMQNGIYERIINLGYIPSPHKYKRNFTPEAHNEFTLLFFRFSAFEPTVDRQAYIGKLFMSERYLESHYNKKYSSRKAYEEDKDGFFMVCKLYFDERSLEYRLNVYPEYVLNICRKDMHYNCRRCGSTEQHWKSLKYLAQLADAHFDNFSKEDNIDSTKAFLKLPDSQINIRQTAYSIAPPTDEDDTTVHMPTFAARNLIRTINLRKQLKIFKVGFLEEDLTTGQTLTLKLTKYPLSEDLIEGTEYTYNFIPGDSLIDDRLAKRGQLGYFVSRNPLYRSLIISRNPDDRYIPGIELSRRLQFAYPVKNEYYKRGGEDGKNYGTEATEFLKEDSTLKSVQQRTDSAKLSFVAPAPEDRILISSSINRSTFWVYGGQEGASAKVPKPGSLLQLLESQYLRDTIPILKDNRWLRGKISFWQVKTANEPTDAADIFRVEPDNKRVKWRVVSTKLVPEQSGSPRHIWIQVVYVNDDNASKRKDAGQVSLSNPRE